MVTLCVMAALLLFIQGVPCSNCIKPCVAVSCDGNYVASSQDSTWATVILICVLQPFQIYPRILLVLSALLLSMLFPIQCYVTNTAEKHHWINQYTNPHLYEDKLLYSVIELFKLCKHTLSPTPRILVDMIIKMAKPVQCSHYFPLYTVLTCCHCHGFSNQSTPLAL